MIDGQRRPAPLCCRVVFLSWSPNSINCPTGLNQPMCLLASKRRLLAVRFAWLWLAVTCVACSPAGTASSSTPAGSGGGSDPGNGISAPPPDVVEGNYGPIAPGPRGPGLLTANPYDPVIELQNLGTARRQTIQASVPFPWGRVQDIAAYAIQGQETSWLVLQTWPDHSVRIAQAQWTETLAAGSSHSYQVVAAAPTEPVAFVPHTVFASGLPVIGAEVVDTFGVSYRAFVEGQGETLQSTAMQRTRRMRGYLRAAQGQGIGRDYLTATFYVTEFRDQPLVLVDWLLGNDYLGADFPNGSSDPNRYALGSVDVNAASFLVSGAALVLPYRKTQDAIEDPILLNGALTAFQVLQNDYLGDGQMRRYRFVLHRDDLSASVGENALARATAAAMVEQPLRPMATLSNWRSTHTLGLLGGGQNPASDAVQRADIEFNAWRDQTAFYGAFGNHGDPFTTGQTGTPRNGTVTPELLHAVQSRDARLLEILEQKAWVQACRPYHLHDLRVEQGNRLFLWDGVPVYPGSRDLSYESLGRRALVLRNDIYAAYRTRIQPGVFRSHGFEHFDVEHWSSDLVFDYYAISGDAWAKDEMRQLGECLRGLVRPAFYYTKDLLPARGEGWIMQGLVQAFVATGDLRYRNFALDRLHNIVERDRPREHPSAALYLGRDEVRTLFPMPHKYYSPWQHAAVLYGYLAAYKFFGDPMLLERCKDAVRCVDYAWVRSYQDPNLGFVANGLRYYAPVEYLGQSVLPSYFDSTLGARWGDGPLVGAHQELQGGLFLLASMVELSNSSGLRALAEQYATHLLRLPLDENDHWDRWFCQMPPQYYR